MPLRLSRLNPRARMLTGISNDCSDAITGHQGITHRERLLGRLRTRPKLGKHQPPFFDFLLQATVLSRTLPVNTGADERHGATSIVQRRLVGESVDALGMDTRELPPQALEQAISRAASHGGTDGLVHHSDHGTQYTGTVHTTQVREYGMLPSTGTIGDSYDNAMAESADGAYKTELMWRRKPFADLSELELATFRWVSWWNSKRLHQSLGYRTSEQIETEYYANQAAQAVSL